MPHSITCPHCGQTVEDAAFCTNCGQSLTAANKQAAPPPEAPPAPADPKPEPRATGDTSAAGAQSAPGRFGRLVPRSRQPRGLLPVPVSGSTRLYRWVLVIGGLLVLLDLLGGNAGSAIVIASVVVPLLLVIYLYDVDLFEDESRIALLVTGIWGGLVGLGFGALCAWLVGRLWIKHATFHIGAAGFGSRFAVEAGFPPVTILFLTGIALPVIALVLLVLGPSFLRRFPSLRNEAMDGVTAGAAAGAGFAIATTIVYFWPLINGPANPQLGVEDWTALLIGLVLLRPLILGVIVAFVCAGLWSFDLANQATKQQLPMALGTGLLVVYALIDLMVQPSGARAELVWLVIVAIIAWVAFRIMVPRALAQDQRQLTNRNLVVCPHCRKLTAPGTYCVACGKPLTPEPAPASAPPAAVRPDKSDDVVEPPAASAPEASPAPNGVGQEAGSAAVPLPAATSLKAAEPVSEPAATESAANAAAPAAGDGPMSLNPVADEPAPPTAAPTEPREMAPAAPSMPWWMYTSGQTPPASESEPKKTDS